MARHFMRKFTITRRKFIAQTLVGLAVATALSPSSHALTSEQQQVNLLANEVMKLARSQQSSNVLRRNFKSLLNKYADMSMVARFALGPYRRKIPANIKARYNAAVDEYIAATFAFYAKDFAGNRIDLNKISKRGNSKVITSKVHLSKGGTAPVNWLVYTGSYGSRITDVQVRGVWMSISMKKRFVDILNANKGDFNALMKYLGEVDQWFN